MWSRVPCEQQLNMGQSVLRERRNPCSRAQWFELTRVLCDADPKGNWVNIPKPRHGDSSFGSQCGNANETGDVGGGPGKSCLFFVRIRIPGIGLPGDRDAGTVKLRGSCGVQSVIAGP